MNASSGHLLYPQQHLHIYPSQPSTGKNCKEEQIPKYPLSVSKKRHWSICWQSKILSDIYIIDYIYMMHIYIYKIYEKRKAMYFCFSFWTLTLTFHNITRSKIHQYSKYINLPKGKRSIGSWVLPAWQLIGRIPVNLINHVTFKKKKMVLQVGETEFDIYITFFYRKLSCFWRKTLILIPKRPKKKKIKKRGSQARMRCRGRNTLVLQSITSKYKLTIVPFKLFFLPFSFW